jgi:MOSC domain-containing protein YiiM
MRDDFPPASNTALCGIFPFVPHPAPAQALPMAPRVRHLYISPGHNFFGHHDQPAGTNPMVEVPEVRCLAGRGLEGDRFLDFKENYKGQVTLFAFETYEHLCTILKVHDKNPGVFRRNIITEGLDLNALIDEEFELQGIRFFGTQESSPCHWMNEAFTPGAERALRGNGGLRAKILSDGILRKE